MTKPIVTSLAKGGYVIGSFGLSVKLCLSVSEQHYSKVINRLQ